MKCIFNFYLFMIGIPFALSCRVKKVPLPVHCIQFCPYKENDILVFESNISKKTDTVFIYKLHQGYTDDDMPRSKVYLGFDVYVFEPYVYADSFYYKKSRILQLGRSYSKGNMCEINFLIGLGTHTNFLSKYYNIDSLYNFKRVSISFNKKNYEDVIMIQNHKIDLSHKDATYIYWSFSEGYVKIIKPNGEEFNLVKKYNDSIACKRMVKLFAQTTDR